MKNKHICWERKWIRWKRKNKMKRRNRNKKGKEKKRAHAPLACMQLQVATASHITAAFGNFFNFYIIFFRFFKNICWFFFANLSPCRRFIRRKAVTDGWTGGKLDGPWAYTLTARYPVVPTFRRMNWQKALPPSYSRL